MTPRADGQGDSATAAFIDRASSELAGHTTEIALIKQDLEAVKSRDGECRNAQHDSWQRMDTRMTATERAVLELGTKLEADNRRGQSRAQVIGQALIALGAVASATVAAWASVHASQASAAALAAAKAAGVH